MSNAAPQQYGKYLLLRRIALGGMAEIFKAKVAGAQGFEKDLIIKRILPAFSGDEGFVTMFIDEARLTAKLQHPNIVQIFDFDVIDGSYYIAMEYVEGKDLKDVIEDSKKQNDPLSVAQCVWIALETAKGLHYAHTKEDKGQPLGIVHRDVTPSNVMISYRGDVKLMDFGIAKAAQRITKTQAGLVKGKVAYMSPEQARGKTLDGRTDVWALSVMLWEMLCRQRLFAAGSDFETLNNVLKMEAPATSSKNPLVPADLDAIVAKGLAKDVNLRWPTAEAMGRELTRWYFTHVDDLEKEKLKPLMYRVFANDIATLEANAREDEAAMSGNAPPASAGGVKEKTVMQTAGDKKPAAAEPPREQATRVMSAADEEILSQPPPRASGTSTGQKKVAEPSATRKAAPEPSATRKAAEPSATRKAAEPSATRKAVDASAGSSPSGGPNPRPTLEERMKESTGTRNRMRTSTATVAHNPIEPEAKQPSKLPWIIVGAVVVVGGIIAAIVAMG